jgi:hypothetical protein
MRKRLFSILVTILVLTVLSPTTVMAAKPVPFAAIGTVTGISPGTVFPAGESGRWVVVERELTGTLSGDVSGNFTMTYKGNVELATQAGNIRGILQSNEYVFQVNGKIQPLEWLGTPYASPAMLTLSGHWTVTTGAQGQGNFDAWAMFIPTPEGHVGTILASSFTMTGQWQP